MLRTLLRRAPALIFVTVAFVTVAPNQEFSARTAPLPIHLPIHMDRLPLTELDVVPPSARVTGTPGLMRTASKPCRTAPLDQTRRRIVDIAAQEWGFFGFRTVDQTQMDLSLETARRNAARIGQPRPRRGGDPTEGERVASTIAGYWAVTPEGSGIVAQQNKAWNGPFGLGARWESAWSAAFISWVMCEAGLGDSNQFKRSVAHMTYIDQAIRARDHKDATAAFLAHDRGETSVEPGDLLCSGARPVFRSLAERRRQLGQGARGHCDVVVQVEPDDRRILTIGGNVGGRVTLKIQPAEVSKKGHLAPRNEAIFAHLKLRAPTVSARALDETPTMKSRAYFAAGSPLAPVPDSPR